MGYLNGYADREFIEELPRFRLPMLGGPGVYRAFEVSDDAMLPVARGTTIVTRYVEDWSTIKDSTPCIIVSTKEISFRRVRVQAGILGLQADNPLHTDSEKPIAEVLEIWEAKSYISSSFPIGPPSLEHLAGLVLDLKQQVAKLTNQPFPTSKA